RLHSAELLLGDLEVDVQQEYERLRAAEQLLRDRDERHQQARFTRPEPEVIERKRTIDARPIADLEPTSKPSKVERWMPQQAVSRRNALKLIGLLGLQGAAAVGTVKVMDQRATDAATQAASGGTPAAVLAAGGANPVDGSDDANPV